MECYRLEFFLRQLSDEPLLVNVIYSRQDQLYSIFLSKKTATGGAIEMLVDPWFLWTIPRQPISRCLGFPFTRKAYSVLL
jgi:hypothetical protein